MQVPNYSETQSHGGGIWVYSKLYPSKLYGNWCGQSIGR
jgi:hypothetical protein